MCRRTSWMRTSAGNGRPGARAQDARLRIGKRRLYVTSLLQRSLRSKRLWIMASICRRQIVDDLADIGILDRRAVDFDHLGHFGLPEILFEFSSVRLGLDVIG